MKRTFQIEWPDDCGRLWLNRDNLLLCLTNTCPKTKFTVADVTDDGACDPEPATVGSGSGRREGTLESVRGAVARGWCHEKNKNKEMDVDLAEAIVQEVALQIGITPI